MFSIKKKNYIISLIVVFILGVGSCLGFVYVSGMGAKISNDNYDEYKRLSVLEDYLKDNYYKEITDSAITTGLYRGLFASVGDPYTVYYTEDEFEKINDELTGENSGIGVVMQGKDEKYIEIVQVIEGAPAEGAGVKVGDKLISVDGEEFSGAQTADAATKVRGEPGTNVKIKVLRDDKELSFTITRDTFINPSVTSKTLDGNLGYIAISTFNENTAEDFGKALENFEQNGVDGLVIDIRNNVGGLVSEGVEIADMLLDECEIAYTENNKKEKEYYRTEDGKTSLPYTLLINENSASTSEILAVGIKENNGGPLVGETTYGKGIIQSLHQFEQGDGVRITIMQYFSASGKPIHDVGVDPDYEVKMNDNSKTDVQLEKAKSLLE